jgi:tRNA A-37 threonylcarbamoyl transferase component Bud32
MSRHQAGVSRIEHEGRPAWCKHYGGGNRRLRLGLLDWVVRAIGVPVLRPPPRHAGDAGRRVEQRRLQALRAAGVHVPEVLAAGDGFLVLGDMGSTLAGRLRQADPDQAGHLLAAAAQALAEVHASGLYLGQPLARNITLDEAGRIGFLDFEEDPGEVLSTAQAQARDWLVFAAGVARHAPSDEERLARTIGHALVRVPPEARGLLATSVGRLGFLRPLTARLGRRAAGIGMAVASLQRALAGVPG